MVLLTRMGRGGSTDRYGEGEVLQVFPCKASSTYLRTYIHSYIHIVHTYIRTYECTYMHAYIQYIHTYIRMYIHAYIHDDDDDPHL